MIYFFRCDNEQTDEKRISENGGGDRGFGWRVVVVAELFNCRPDGKGKGRTSQHNLYLN